MACQTGVVELDAAIEAFLADEWQDQAGELWPVETLSEPGVAAHACYEIADQFVCFLRERGLTAHVSGGAEDEQAQGSPDAFGYADRCLSGEPTHHLAYLDADGERYAVDFACAQYGYTEFPLVQRLAADGRWQRTWS
jgi:hypothetical protein